MTTPGAITDRLCSLLASRADHNPIGTGSTITRLLAVETPPPWGDQLYEGDPDGTVQQRMYAVGEAYYERIRAAGNAETIFASGYPAAQGIAPDAEWSDPAVRRVLLITRPAGDIGQFHIAEYHFPIDSLRVVDLTRAFFDAPDEIEALDEFRVEHAGHREFFVCTHGQVDICCAKFGVPLYLQARRAYPQVRAWRMTHFGGHRYAPTAWEFPSGYKWGFLDAHAADRVLERDGHPADLGMHLRGWSGVPSQVQLLDRLGLRQFGWDWLDFTRAGEVIEADEDARRWRVRLTYTSPTGTTGAYEGVVVVARELHEAGCGQGWGDHDYQVPEYALESVIESPNT